MLEDYVKAHSEGNDTFKVDSRKGSAISKLGLESGLPSIRFLSASVSGALFLDVYCMTSLAKTGTYGFMDYYVLFRSTGITEWTNIKIRI
jgi:hypothetical protein